MQNCTARLSSLRERRLHERIDGSLTPEKARKNRLEAVVLRTMVEDGLRRALALLGDRDLSAFDKLQLRWAAVEARAAAHEAVETVPLPMI